MIIANRVLMGVMVLFCFIIIHPGYGYANNNLAEWEIVAFDDQTIQETVKIYDQEIEIDTSVWEKSTNEEAVILTRKVDNWLSYNELTDKLPIQAVEKNYLLWHKTSLIVNAGTLDDTDVFNQIKNKQDINVIISLSGFVTATSGERLSENAAAWRLERTDSWPEGEVILKSVTLQGFIIGVTGFVLGLIIIGIVFIRRMKKVEQLMEEEYSLENITLETLQEKDNEPNEEEDNWN